MGRVHRLHTPSEPTVALSGLWDVRPGRGHYETRKDKQHIISIVQSVERKFNRFPCPDCLIPRGCYSKWNESTQILDFRLSMELQYSGYSG
jgi:hypothetical protein